MEEAQFSSRQSRVGVDRPCGAAVAGADPDATQQEAAWLREGPVERLVELIRLREQQALEISDLRSALSTRSVIDQAKGILMARYNATADQAFAILRRWSQARNVKVRVLARALVDAAPLRAGGSADEDGAPVFFLGRQVNPALPQIDTIEPLD